MGQRKALDDDDFPLKVEEAKIRTRQDKLVATAETAEAAKELVERLNEDQQRRHEGKWTL